MLPVLPEGATRKRNVVDVLETLKAKGGDAKIILIRVDFNVPMDYSVDPPKITDDSRIRGALPTIKAVLEAGHNSILVSHMGRPKLVQAGGSDAETAKQAKDLSLAPVAAHLSKLLQIQVLFGGDCLKADGTVAQLRSNYAGGKGVALLENLRFYKAEEKNVPDFAKTLASYADAYVNDAFGTCHRAHASVSGVPALLPSEVCGIGCLVASELAYLDFSSDGGKSSNIAAIIGGSKVSTKLPVIQGLLKNVNTLVLGGGLAFTFLKAQGVTIGDSLLEESMVETAKNLLEQAASEGKTIVIPVDSVCASSFPSGPVDPASTRTFDTVPGAGIEDGWMGLDAGPKTLVLLKKVLGTCTKIVMNGPLGVFEVPPFDKGTRGLVQILKEVTANGTVTVVGGGDSVAALEAFGETKSVSYVSTGGGATLELLAGDILPGVAAIADYTP